MGAASWLWVVVACRQAPVVDLPDTWRLATEDGVWVEGVSLSTEWRTLALEVIH